MFIKGTLKRIHLLEGGTYFMFIGVKHYKELNVLHHVVNKKHLGFYFNDPLRVFCLTIEKRFF